MSYTKLTDFASKDALLTGNPSKLVRGTELGAEFDAIETADALNIKPDTVTAATGKTTPVDADLLTLFDSASTFSLKKLTWANLKATLKTYFDTLYAVSGANNNITSLTALTAGGLPDNSVLTADIADAQVTPAKLSQPFTSGTSVATTSGSAINFTSVPSWVKRISITLFGVSVSGVDIPAIQIGTGGVVTTSGYKNETHYVGGTAVASVSSFLFGVNGGAAANTYHGEVVLVKTTGNTWVMSGVVAVLDANAGVCVSGGSVALAGALDIVSLMITGGQTFDAGSVNIHYE